MGVTRTKRTSLGREKPEGTPIRRLDHGVNGRKLVRKGCVNQMRLLEECKVLTKIRSGLKKRGRNEQRARKGTRRGKAGRKHQRVRSRGGSKGGPASGDRGETE